MSILTRFKDIMASNVNALLDKMEDPAKMVDQYLLNMTKDLAEIKKETANVIAEETRAKRLADENKNEVERYLGLTEKALLARNESDAMVFMAKKQELESTGAGLQTTYAVARENAAKMRQMHDKLTQDISALNARKNMIKAKAAVAKTQERVNQFTTPGDSGGAEAFERLEDKVDKRLDAANAMADLNAEPVDEAKALAEKYKNGTNDASVQAELEAMKARLGLKDKPENAN